ncbi:MAG: response regulator [Alphaproteobacteria bacterium]|nr:response regulator [Alphaproteobacteria bacterium]
MMSLAASTSVLIVEDDSIIAWHLRSMVERLGFAVCATVATEQAAVDAAREHEPAIVLMDVRLAAGGDGVRAAEAICAVRAVPVIFCTAHAHDPDFRSRVAPLATAAVLGKPIQERLLKETITGLLGRT